MLAEQLERYRMTTEKLCGRKIPASEGSLEFVLCLMREIHDLRAADRKSRESGCWCDEHGHPCAGCEVKQENAALRHKVADTEQANRMVLERLRGAGDRKVMDGSVILAAPFLDSVLSACSIPCPCDQLRAELDHRETEYRILSDADEELEAERDQLREDHAALCDEADSYRKTTETLLGREIPAREGRLEGWLCSMRKIHDLRAENAALRRQVAAHQKWLAQDSQYAENKRLTAENAELRESVNGWLDQVMRSHAILREVLEAVLGRRL